jgi:monovalent cation:H+ antiporter-2, CPA2 family
MHGYELILTLTAGLGAALFFGFITQRVGLSPIVGYLIAGTIVGPNTPGLVVDATIAERLAEVGVILLMFGVGLQFHVNELLAVRGIAVPGALGMGVAATALGALLGASFGMSWTSGIVFGLTLSVASTVVVIRVLSDHNVLHTPAGHIAVGWLVVEDVFTVIALVLLPAMFGGEEPQSPWIAIGATILKMAALVAFTAIVGARLIPRLLDFAAMTKSRELFTLTVLVIALGIAAGSASVFGVSMALGAFLAGMVVGRSDYSLRAASDALPMRDAFAVLFFVSVGMLLDIGALFESPWLFAGAVAIVAVANPVVAFAVMWLARQRFKTSLLVAVALAQIGEFSFILSTIARDLELLSVEATNIVVAASIASIIANPVLFSTIEPIARWVSRRPWLCSIVERFDNADAGVAGKVRRTEQPAHRALLIGYGPTGRTVARMLKENGIEPTVVEFNIETVRELRELGIDAVYGDATRAQVLDEAGIATANNLILTSAGMANSEEVIRAARDANPKVRVLARASYLRDLPGLKKAGADTVFTGEGEVALAFVEEMLERLGATAEQIDRERNRAHDELFGDGPGSHAPPD